VTPKIHTEPQRELIHAGFLSHFMDGFCKDIKLVAWVGKMVHIKCHRKCASSTMLIVGFCVFWQFSTLKGLNSCPLTFTSSGMQLQNFGHDTANTHFQGGPMLFSNSR